MTPGCLRLETKKVVTVDNILSGTLRDSLSRLKIAVIHNTSVIDRHFRSPESIFCEKHHRTSVHEQSFCESTDTGPERLRAQFPRHVQMARCICTAEAGGRRSQPDLQVRIRAGTVAAPAFLNLFKELSQPQRQIVSNQLVGSSGKITLGSQHVTLQR